MKVDVPESGALDYLAALRGVVYDPSDEYAAVAVGREVALLDALKINVFLGPDVAAVRLDLGLELWEEEEVQHG